MAAFTSLTIKRNDTSRVAEKVLIRVAPISLWCRLEGVVALRVVCADVGPVAANRRGSEARRDGQVADVCERANRDVHRCVAKGAAPAVSARKRQVVVAVTGDV